jgi:integrase
VTADEGSGIAFSSRRKTSMHLRQRGAIWYATFYDEGGKRAERSTGVTDETAARAILATWEREAADPDRGAAAMTLNDALAMLVEDRQARVRNGSGSQETVDFYRKKAGHLVRVFGHDFRLARLKDAAQVWRYIDARRAEGMLDTSIEREITTLRGALRLAKERCVWKGDIEGVIPSTFEPVYKPRERSPRRQEALALLPHLLPDAAAAVAFILATSAEDAAMVRARREDVSEILDDASPRVHVRGSKNKRRDRLVPIVSDEQRLLLTYALKHAQGVGPRLFRSLSNLRRAILEACEHAGIAPLSPHSLRKAAGQWLIDLGVPLELVSRVLGHADTRITETVYAKVREEDVNDRILDAIDPRYAKKAHKARGARKLVDTIKKLPEPKSGRVLYEVAGVRRTLGGWATITGIAKTTLHHRVVTSGMPLADALALGRGTKGRPLMTASAARTPGSATSQIAPLRPSSCPAYEPHCRTGAADGMEKMDGLDQLEPVRVPSAVRNLRERPQNSVPRDGIEPPTRGFSIRPDKAEIREIRASFRVHGTTAVILPRNRIRLVTPRALMATRGRWPRRRGRRQVRVSEVDE